MPGSWPSAKQMVTTFYASVEKDNARDFAQIG